MNLEDAIKFGGVDDCVVGSQTNNRNVVPDIQIAGGCVVLKSTQMSMAQQKLNDSWPAQWITLQKNEIN